MTVRGWFSSVFRTIITPLLVPKGTDRKTWCNFDEIGRESRLNSINNAAKSLTLVVFSAQSLIVPYGCKLETFISENQAKLGFKKCKTCTTKVQYDNNACSITGIIIPAVIENLDQ